MDGGMNRSLEPLLVMWPLVRTRVKQLCGLVLRDDQAYLMNRLEPTARQKGFANVATFLSAALAGNRAELDRALVETLTTHETSFFRDPPFWEALRNKVIPAIIAKEKGRPLRFWSAASSTGQEAYSFAMIMYDYFPKVEWEGWATDVAEETLARAEQGLFTVGETERGLLPGQMGKHFDREGTLGWRAKEHLRRRFRYDQYNLLGSASPLGSFDLVMCRNVLVYFEPEDRHRVIDRLVKSLTPIGWLGLGSTELPTGPQKDISRVQDGAGWMERKGA